MLKRFIGICGLIISIVVSAPIFSQNDITDFQGKKKDLGEVKRYLDEINYLVEQQFVQPSDPVLQQNFPRFYNKNKSADSFSDYLYQGDMLLTPSQAKEILDDIKYSLRNEAAGFGSDTSRVKRKFYAGVAAKWNKFPIPFKIHNYLDDVSNNIFEAIQILEHNTCLRFEHINYFDNRPLDHIEFVRQKGCFSNYGRLGGKNVISIGFRCEKVGIIAHEIGHSLGLTHEQSRPDRDCCVKVMPNNIRRGGYSFFVKQSWHTVNTYGTPYDLGSVMHYSGIGFAVDQRINTLDTTLPGYQKTIGQREQLSFYDIEIINEAYECKKQCQTRLPCKRGGYAHPNFCDKCLCPEGLGGRYCETYEESQGKRILLEFLGEFKFYCERTCYDYVEVKNSTDLANTGMRFCCFDLPQEIIYSTGNEMLVIFKSVTDYSYRGFKAKISTYPNIAEIRVLPLPPQNIGNAIGITAQKLKMTHDFTGWSDWYSWSPCSRTCGACGVKTRRRTCLKPPCLGDEQKNRRCGFKLCPGVTECRKFMQKDDRCGPFSQQICLRSVSVVFDCPSNSTCCPPFEPVQGFCRLPSRQRASWSAWTEWSECSGPPCGGCAVQARRRICNDLRCEGSELEHKRCNKKACDECMPDSSKSNCYCCEPLRRAWWGMCDMGPR